MIEKEKVYATLAEAEYDCHMKSRYPSKNTRDNTPLDKAIAFAAGVPRESPELVDARRGR